MVVYHDGSMVSPNVVLGNIIEKLSNILIHANATFLLVWILWYDFSGIFPYDYPSFWTS